VFNRIGDIKRCALRPGNVHSAAGCRAVLEPVIASYRDIVKRLYFRGAAAFANPEMYEFLEAAHIGYAIRLRANSVLQRRIGYLLKRPVGRPPHEVHRYYASFTASPYGRRAGTCRAASWPGRVASRRALPARRLYRHQTWRGLIDHIHSRGYRPSRLAL
jgi:hypothetical protein